MKNMSLLSKWWWRFHNEPNGLWRRVITSMNYSNRNCSLIPLKSNMVGVWKTIATLNSHLAPFNVSLEKDITGLVGNGSSIRFWVDTWIGGSPLRETYPDLYKLKRHKGCFINKRCTGRGRFTQWEWNWVRPPSSHNELFELQNLITQVIHLSLSASNDIWVWKYDTSGSFTTKSLKSLLQSTTYGPNHRKFPWNHLAPLKVNIFGWRLEMN